MYLTQLGLHRSVFPEYRLDIGLQLFLHHKDRHNPLSSGPNPNPNPYLNSNYNSNPSLNPNPNRNPNTNPNHNPDLYPNPYPLDLTSEKAKAKSLGSHNGDR